MEAIINEEKDKATFWYQWPSDELEEIDEIEEAFDWEEEVNYWGYRSRWPGKI